MTIFVVEGQGMNRVCSVLLCFILVAACFIFFPNLGYGQASVENSWETISQTEGGGRAVIAGIIVAVTVIAVAGLVVFHFKHASTKPT
ncbi:MAG: hypothetical protein NWF01_10120 [Candidatus Bathyarchaeota archaeon]|nr:hypothetical protein [Candidatus Bathyarchaeota archaeon]